MRKTRHPRCTLNWARTVRMVYTLNMLGRGLCLDRVRRGLDLEMKRKHPARRSPWNVAWPSENLTPSRYRTLWLYARMRAFRARILNICRVVTRVQRPCLITWLMLTMLGDLLVKGAAMEASPSSYHSSQY